MTDTPEEPPVDGEILSSEEQPSQPQDGNTNWLALISNYTERPDLFLAEVEKHDPGFTARMNDDARIRAERDSIARFNFSRTQAYVSLGVAVIAAMMLLYTIYSVAIKTGSFGSILALGAVYAITQGGSLGFSKLISTLSELVSKAPKE